MGGTYAEASALSRIFLGQVRDNAPRPFPLFWRVQVQFLNLLKRSPRSFNVKIGNPWTINGKDTECKTPKSVLREIYDIATYFPITITVEGPESSYELEMDEYMNTRPVGSDNERPQEETNNRENIATAPVATVPDRTAEPTLSSVKVKAQKVLAAYRRPLAIGGLILLLAIVVLVGIVLSKNHDAQAISAGDGPSWQSSIPANTSSQEDLDGLYRDQLWELEPSQVDSASWFAAGVVVTDDDQIALLDSHDGEEIAHYKVSEDVNLNEDLEWVAEFYHKDTPSVGLRIGNSFVAITSEGETQAWTIPTDMDVGVYGTTPYLTNASNVEKPSSERYQALRVGEEEPQELAVNPSLVTRAVDDKWLVQLVGDAPRVALNPADRSDKDLEPQAIELTAPTEDAEFVQHLDAGHGNTMALWQVEDQQFLGIHPLFDQTPGKATTFVPSPFSGEEVTGWTVGRGMNVLLVGPYAISISSGKLVSFTDAGDFTNAYGPAAVTTTANEKRSFIIDDTKYTEENQIIGYDGQGLIFVRKIDGSVAAYGEYGGKA